MKNQWNRGVTNAFLLALILVVSAISESDLGGPETFYNAVNVGLIATFLMFNPHFDTRTVAFFAAPLAFLYLSVAANADTLHPGGYRTAGAITAGYALFMLKPVPVHQRLLWFLVVGFLIGALGISLIVARDTFSLAFDSANANFNVNPNSAALFFVQGVMLSIAIIQGWLGWLIAVPYLLLTVTTLSRAGTLCAFMVLVGYALFSQSERYRGSALAPLLAIGRNWKVWAVLAIVGVLAVRYIPVAADTLITRFEAGESRAEQWDEGWGGIRTMRDWFIGSGPATLSFRTQSTAHNSYIEAIGNSGVFFLVTTLLALALWLRRVVLDGCRDMLWILPPVLIYGLVENILFSGISTLWLLLMWLSIALRSRSAGLDVARHVDGSRRSRRRLTHDRLVVGRSPLRTMRQIR